MKAKVVCCLSPGRHLFHFNTFRNSISPLLQNFSQRFRVIPLLRRSAADAQPPGPLCSHLVLPFHNAVPETVKGLARGPAQFGQRCRELVVRGLQEIQLEGILQAGTTQNRKGHLRWTHNDQRKGAAAAHLVELLLRVFEVLLGWERWISRVGFDQLSNTFESWR